MTYITLSRPLLNLVICLVAHFYLPLRHGADLADSIVSGIDVDATINLFGRAQRRQGFGAHVAEHAVASYEVGAPRSLGRAYYFSVVLCQAGYDELPLHPRLTRLEAATALGWLPCSFEIG